MKSAQYYIEKLGMTPHVEGGYFKQSVLSEEMLTDWGWLFLKKIKNYLVAYISCLKQERCLIFTD